MEVSFRSQTYSNINDMGKQCSKSATEHLIKASYVFVIYWKLFSLILFSLFYSTDPWAVILLHINIT